MNTIEELEGGVRGVAHCWTYNWPNIFRQLSEKLLNKATEIKNRADKGVGQVLKCVKGAADVFLFSCCVFSSVSQPLAHCLIQATRSTQAVGRYSTRVSRALFRDQDVLCQIQCKKFNSMSGMECSSIPWPV